MGFTIGTTTWSFSSHDLVIKWTNHISSCSKFPPTNNYNPYLKKNKGHLFAKETMAYITYSACHQLNNLPSFRRRVTLRVTMTVSLVLLTVASNCPKPLTNMLPYLGGSRILSNQRWKETLYKHQVYVLTPANQRKEILCTMETIKYNLGKRMIKYLLAQLFPISLFFLLAWVASFWGYMPPWCYQWTKRLTTLGEYFLRNTTCGWHKTTDCGRFINQPPVMYKTLWPCNSDTCYSPLGNTGQ